MAVTNKATRSLPTYKMATSRSVSMTMTWSMVILLLVQTLSASLGCFISNCPVSGKKRSGADNEQTQPKPYQAVAGEHTQPYQADTKMEVEREHEQMEYKQTQKKKDLRFLLYGMAHTRLGKSGKLKAF